MPIQENDFPMNKTLLFLLSGKAGVGKTFSASHIAKITSDAKYSTQVFSFAREVKSVARIMGWDGRKDSKGRAYLQKIGQIGRWYNENLWVSNTLNFIHASSGIFPYDIVCIDDWRFPNEFNYIIKTQLAFKVVAIRVNSPDRESLKGTEEYNEVSETALDTFELFDYVIQNPVEEPTSILTSLTDIVSLEILKNRRGDSK